MKRRTELLSLGPLTCLLVVCACFPASQVGPEGDKWLGRYITAIFQSLLNGPDDIIKVEP